MSSTIASSIQTTPSFERAADVASDVSAGQATGVSSGSESSTSSQDVPDRPAGEALSELARSPLPDWAGLARTNPLLDFSLIGFGAPTATLLPGFAPSFTAANAATPDRGITEAQYASVAKSLGVDVAAIKAVAKVESAGGGFLPSGRAKILFEAHIFHDKTGGQFDKKHPNLSSKTWDKSLYGKGGEHQWTRFDAASKLDATAAMESASWGRFQIMGFNFKAAGFTDVTSFVQAMQKDEGAQLAAFGELIKSRPSLLTALRNHDWADFAEGYNGKAYKKNDYDTKLAAAHAAFSK
ncbi:MAG: hypothetical protein RLZZ618_808 [Pseudomonadota bacterium]|jgi:hypothetical protein